MGLNSGINFDFSTPGGVPITSFLTNVDFDGFVGQYFLDYVQSERRDVFKRLTEDRNFIFEIETSIYEGFSSPETFCSMARFPLEIPFDLNNGDPLINHIKLIEKIGLLTRSQIISSKGFSSCGEIPVSIYFKDQINLETHLTLDRNLAGGLLFEGVKYNNLIIRTSLNENEKKICLFNSERHLLDEQTDRNSSVIVSHKNAIKKLTSLISSRYNRFFLDCDDIDESTSRLINLNYLS